MEYITDNPLFTRVFNSVKEFAIVNSQNNEKYIGSLKNGKKSGFGKIIYASGDIFEGDFKDDKKNGAGKMIYTKENITLIGKWENDKKVGEGIFTWPSGGQLKVNWDN